MATQALPPASESEAVPALVLGGVPTQPGDTLDDFVFEGVVATGGMAHVLRVRDPQGEERALKVLKSSRIESGLPRFRREFHALRRVEHPNVIRVHGWGSLRGHPYISMEYVEGKDLHTVIRAFKELEPEVRWRRCEEILADLCRALAYIHRKGLVHRDLKPSNVMVDTTGRCKLTDFGIVKDLDPSNDPFVSTTLVGTWAYASPEQITGQALDHRSDLYSLGVILYAMLTGRRPFAARDMAGYLTQHRDKQPLAPRRLDTAIPEHLEEICLQLLEKAPRDRFQSANEVLRVLERTEALSPDPNSTEEGLWEPSLVGRTEQLEILRDAVSALTRGQGGVVLLEGVEGSGRTRMLRVAIDHADVIGIPVHESSLGGKPSSYGALVDLARDIGKELGARVPGELQRAITAFARGRGQMAGDLRYQLYDGVRETLETLLEDGPRILALDDLHQAQQPLLALLAYLVRTVVIRDARPLLVVATARNDLDSPAFRSFRDGTELGMEPTVVTLEALSAGDVARLVVSILGEGVRSEQLAIRLYEETRGNPFFVAEFLRTLVLQARDEPLEERPPELEEADASTEVMKQHLDIPPGVRQVVLGRLARLDPDERALVEALAVAGREVDQDVLLDVMEVGEEEEGAVLARLDTLVKHGFLVERRSALHVLVAFAHHKVGEILYRDLSPERRKALHRQYGLILEELESDNPVIAEAIGEHFRQGGEPALAYRYLVAGAQRLWERSLLVDASSLIERAQGLEDVARLGLSASEFRSSRLDFLQVKSRLLFNRGAWSEAELALRDLRTTALELEQRMVAGRASLDLGTTLRRLGRRAEGASLVQEVLKNARARHDRVLVLDALRRLASFAWDDGDLDEVERLANEGLIGANGQGLEEGRAELLLALTAAQASRGHLASATSGMSEAESILRSLRNKRGRAVVLGNLAELHVWQGEMGRAVERASEGISLARDVLYREGEAFGLRTRGMALLDAGDHAQAEDDLQRSLAIVQELGVTHELPATCYLLAHLSLRLGRTDDALRFAELGLESTAKGDPEEYRTALEAQKARALARLGQLDAAELILRGLSGVPARLTLPRRLRLELLLAAAWRALGRTEEARLLAVRVANTAGARGFRMWALNGRFLEHQLTSGPQAETAREAAAVLARHLLAPLPPELAEHFKRRAGFSSLWLDEHTGGVSASEAPAAVAALPDA